jgi:hypothetical protein
MTLKLTHVVQEARVPRPPVWRYTPTANINLPDTDDYTISLTLPHGVPPSPTQIALMMAAYYDGSAGVVGQITIDGVSCTERFRTDSTTCLEFAWCQLPAGRGGDTVTVVRTGSGGQFRQGNFVMVLLDGMDMVTTWPTPADAADDINVAPSYLMTMLKGALSFHATCANASSGTTTTNATMVEQDTEIIFSRRSSWGYRESPSDDTALAFTGNSSAGDTVQMGVAFNPTLDKAYL